MEKQWLPKRRQYFLAFDNIRGKLARSWPFRCRKKRAEMVLAIDYFGQPRKFKIADWHFEPVSKKRFVKINCLDVVRNARSAEQLDRILETMNIRGIRLLCVYYKCEKEELKERILSDKK